MAGRRLLQRRWECRRLTMEAYQRLEREWAEFNGLDPAGMVACASGTAALHLALEAFRLPPGSEVLVPDYAMVACPRAVVMAGLTPVFVDCDERLLIDLKTTWERIPAESARIIMPVHVYGRRVDMDQLFKAVTMPNEQPCLYVVEDLAEAHGVRPHPQTDAACWSFFANKHVHGEEGGAVWFRDSIHANLARQLRCVGFTEAHDYRHVPRGMNYRLANTLAALILTSVGEFGMEQEERRYAEQVLDRHCPAGWRMPPRDATWVYDFRVPGMTKPCQDAAIAALKERGIAARHGFYPMHLQDEFLECRRVGGDNAERASREVIYVPLRVTSLPAFEVVKTVASQFATSAG